MAIKVTWCSEQELTDFARAVIAKYAKLDVDLFIARLNLAVKTANEKPKPAPKLEIVSR